MEKFNKLHEELSDAEEAAREARSNMSDYLTPIIKAYEGKDKVWGEYKESWVSGDSVHITYEHWASGGPYEYNYAIPISVLQKAEADAIEAARKAREAREQAKRDAQRAKDEAAFEALRIKLGK